MLLKLFRKYRFKGVSIETPLLLFLFLLFFKSSISAESSPINYGYLTGQWDTSVGVHLWSDRSVLRNFQFHNTTNLWPGYRLNAVIRSNNEMEEISTFAPEADELYLEKYAFFNFPRYDFAYSLKGGEMRYLRFPYPDITSMFDQVPGIEDQKGRGLTSYKGVMLTSEVVSKQNLGVHLTLLQWVDSPQHGLSTIEQYGFWRPTWGWLEGELRVGRIADRTFRLGTGSEGGSLYLGARFKSGARLGFLYEYNDSEGVRTGILMEMTLSKITEFMGEWRMDYTRSPRGIGLQPDLFKGTYGFAKTVPEGAQKVGEMVTEEVITYWQNGQGRNYYEHLVSVSGETSGDDLIIVRKPGKRYLRVESLVSLYNKFQSYDDLMAWEETRQGPAQLARTVVYDYYKNSLVSFLVSYA